MHPTLLDCGAVVLHFEWPRQKARHSGAHLRCNVPEEKWTATPSGVLFNDRLETLSNDQPDAVQRPRQNSTGRCARGGAGEFPPELANTPVGEHGRRRIQRLWETFWAATANNSHKNRGRHGLEGSGASDSSDG